MRKIRILCAGKNKDPYIKQGMAVFEKKIRRHCDLRIEFVKQANYSGNDKKTWLEKEAGELLKRVSPRGYSVACDEKGELLTSVELSKKFVRWSNQGYSQFDFIVGGPYGLAESLKKKVKLTLSFSPMTMTHQLFRLVLMEQIYRSFTIIKGEKYHH